MNFRILNKALHNNGYRYVGKKEGIHVYGKPIGYGYLCAYVCDVDAGANLEITLIVKEKQQQKDGTRLNWPWTHSSVELLVSSGEDEYLLFVQAIKDCEAEIFDKTPISWEMNRDVRYDFEENPALQLDLF